MKTCLYCGESFEPRRSDQKYCSHKHRTYYGRRMKREALLALELEQERRFQALVSKLQRFAPKTAASIQGFAKQQGAACALAAVNLCLTAYYEASRTAI